MLMIHGMLGSIDYTIRVATPAWCHSTANLQMGLFLVVLLNAIGEQWEKSTEATKKPPPRKLYWQCDRGMFLRSLKMSPTLLPLTICHNRLLVTRFGYVMHRLYRSLRVVGSDRCVR